MITCETDLQTLFAYTREAVEELEPGEKFMVRDLFKGFQWNRIPKGLRTKLGGLFYRFVTEERSEDFEPVGKTPQNQQIYKKK